MGGRMAKRLLDAGHPVIGYNRTRGKARWLADAGLRLVDSPREVAAQAEIVFTMVTDTPALDAVCRGSDGILAGLRRDAVHVEMSRSEEHTSELQSHSDLVCRLLLEKKKLRTSIRRRAKCGVAARASAPLLPLPARMRISSSGRVICKARRATHWPTRRMTSASVCTV